MLDLSCRKQKDDYYIVTDRWQKFTKERVTEQVLEELSGYAAEFLVHAVDVEGKASGIEKELAEMLEVSPTHVKHIESGHRKPSIEILFEIAKILNISLDSVVFSKNESAHTDTREKIDRLLDISDEASLRFILSVLEALREKEQAGVR